MRFYKLSQILSVSKTLRHLGASYIDVLNVIVKMIADETEIVSQENYLERLMND